MTIENGLDNHKGVKVSTGDKKYVVSLMRISPLVYNNKGYISEVAVESDFGFKQYFGFNNSRTHWTET